MHNDSFRIATRILPAAAFTVALGAMLVSCNSSNEDRSAAQDPAATAINDTHSPNSTFPSFMGGTSPSNSNESSVVTVGLYGETPNGSTPISGTRGEGNLKQVSFASEGGDFTPDIDRKGTFLVYSSKQHSTNFDLYRKTIEGRTVTQLSSDPCDDIMPSLCPDGSKVAFASNRTGNWDIFVMPTDGGPATQMTFESDDEVQPTWSPDGKTLGFARKNCRTSRWEIWTSDATQPSGATYLCDGFLPRWCPDAKQHKLLFQRARQQGSRLYGVWTIDLVNGEAMHPTEIVSAQNAAIIQPNWSPDGNCIVFTSVVEPNAQSGDLPDQSDLWIVKLDGSGRTSLTTGQFRNMQAVWGPNDKIYFVSNRGGIENLWTVSMKSGGEMSAPTSHGAVAGAHEPETPATTMAHEAEMPSGHQMPASEHAPETAPGHTPNHS